MSAFMRKVYNGFDTGSDIEPAAWREALRLMNEATVDGLSRSDVPPTYEEEFYRELKHSNEVFAAFKVHSMGEKMAAKLTTPDGKLKPFRQWAEDVRGISSHYVGSWLRTEYDTAVLRAHAAADWRRFERDKDIMPNLRWMPTTSPEPESTHRLYWQKKLTLPVDHPFWEKHHPGDRWNCKCMLEQTDEPANPEVLEDVEDIKPQRGLENNPGKDGHTFNDTHPYFPTGCNSCPFNQGFKNKIGRFFKNGKKHCYSCSKIDIKIANAKNCNDVREMLTELSRLSGIDYVRQLRKIASLKIYKKVGKEIFSAIDTDSADYENLFIGAKKAVKHGYKVYILPNPKGVRSADYIFERKGVFKMFDLKTITGTGSIGTRLKESIGQTNRVFLNLSTKYNANRMAIEIKKYFEDNSDALEVLVAVGNKVVSVERTFIMKRTFFKEFRIAIEK